MQTHPERFPYGMRPVVDYIHALGLRAGIYSDAGSNTCGSVYDNDVNGIGAGFYGHDRQDADRYFRDWGFDFIKIDYCGGHELGLDEESRYRAIYRAIRATGRNDIRINCVVGPSPAYGLGRWLDRGVSMVILLRTGSRSNGSSPEIFTSRPMRAAGTTTIWTCWKSAAD